MARQRQVPPAGIFGLQNGRVSLRIRKTIRFARLSSSYASRGWSDLLKAAKAEGRVTQGSCLSDDPRHRADSEPRCARPLCHMLIWSLRACDHANDVIARDRLARRTVWR